MGTGSQDTHQRNYDRQPRWDRFDNVANLFEHYRELQAQGLSQRQVAQELQVPRTTLQARRTWHDSLDICPHVAEFFQKRSWARLRASAGLWASTSSASKSARAGIRLACLFLKLTGLDRFVAASYGAQQTGQLPG